MISLPIESTPQEALARLRLRSAGEINAVLDMLLPELPDRWLAEMISARMESVKADGLLCIDGETVAECLDTEVRGGIPGSHQKQLDDFIYRISGSRVPPWERLSDDDVKSVARELHLGKRRQPSQRDYFDFFGLDRNLPKHLRGKVTASLSIRTTYPDYYCAQLFVTYNDPNATTSHIHCSNIRNAEDLKNNLARAAAASVEAALRHD
jgi:hypothetical protein